MTSKVTNVMLFALHIAVAAVILSAMWSHYTDRQNEHQRIEQQAAQAKQRAEARSKDVEVKKAVLSGLQQDDPYVIEKIAREAYDYVGPNELSPAGH